MRIGRTAAGAPAIVCATHSTNCNSGALAAFNGAARPGASCAAAAASMPSHITGAIAAAASRFAGSAASETVPKCIAISGAVPRVAATVMAATSATGPGTRRASASRSGGAIASSAPTAANESCHPGSPAARGLRISVTAAARPSAYQRCVGPPARAATSPAAPITPARWIDGPAPVSGTYRAISASATPNRIRSRTPSSAPAPRTSVASSITFWPLTASTWARPDRLKSSRTSSESCSSWPSTMPRRSAASGGASPRPSPVSARRRTVSTNPATPPRRVPVRRISSTSSAASAPRRR